MNFIQKTCLILTIIGALNWGLIGLFSFNLVESIFGVTSLMTSIIYTLVGIAGLVNILLLFMDFDPKRI